jgi:hypothetical protein
MHRGATAPYAEMSGPGKRAVLLTFEGHRAWREAHAVTPARDYGTNG